MRLPPGLLGLALGLALAPGVRAQEPAGPVPPRRAIAGLRGVQVRSTLSFDGVGEEQTWVTTFVFPERARIAMHVRGGLESRRRIHYRYGSDAWSLPPATKTSLELEGEARDDLLRDLELRRAAFLWPDGFDWRASSKGERRASLGSLGELAAELDAEGRPARLWAVGPEGQTKSRFAIEAWREAFDRRWPERWSVVVDGRTVAHETVERIDVSVHLVEAFFRPPDRRASSNDLPEDVAHTDLPSAVERVVPLTDDERRSWSAALAAWRRHRADAEGELVSTPIFELDANAHPRAVVLRLAECPEPLPSGWRERPERPGMSRIGLTPRTVDASMVRTLAAGRPSDTRVETTYLRLSRAALDARSQLVIRLAEPRN